jgi:DNA invertase Pin-like site-specific DNA recombinase
MKTAYSYLRFSHPKQMSGDSRRRQQEWGEAAAARHGWLLDKGLRMEDCGVSAFKGRNARTGALASFLEAVRNRVVKPGSVLLVESLDRLSREEQDEAYDLFRGIIKSGVEIHTRDPERHYDRDSLRGNPMAMIEPILIMSRAHEESQMKSTRGSEAWKTRRERMARKLPVTRQLPAWVRLAEDGAHFETVPEAVAAVRRVFLLAARGVGIRGISTLLNGGRVKRTHELSAAEAALLGDLGTPAIGKLGAWGRSYVAKLLKDRRVLGEHQPHVMRDGRRVPHGPPIPDFFPAIVTPEEWARARVAKRAGQAAGGKPERGAPNLFVGLLKDARDGQAMHLKHHRHGTLHFVSNGAMNGERGSANHSFPYAVFEEAFLGLLRELTAKDILPGPGGPGENRETQLRAELATVEENLATLKKRVAQTPSPSLLEVVTELDKRKAEAEAELEALQVQRAAAQPDALESCKTLAAMLRDVQAEELAALRLRVKAALRWLVREILVLVIPIGWERLAAVQARFADGKRHRTFLIAYKPAQGRGKAPAVPLSWEARSLAGMVDDVDALDLHDRAQVEDLERTLLAAARADPGRPRRRRRQ